MCNQPDEINFLGVPPAAALFFHEVARGNKVLKNNPIIRPLSDDDRRTPFSTPPPPLKLLPMRVSQGLRSIRLPRYPRCGQGSENAFPTESVTSAREGPERSRTNDDSDEQNEAALIEHPVPAHSRSWGESFALATRKTRGPWRQSSTQAMCGSTAGPIIKIKARWFNNGTSSIPRAA